MDKEVLSLMVKLEKTIEKLETGAFFCLKSSDRELLAEECKKTLGFKEHVIWHINFNIYQFTDKDNIITDSSAYTFRVFNQSVKEFFEKITQGKNMDINILYIIFNKYIIDKERGILNSM